MSIYDPADDDSRERQIGKHGQIYERDKPKQDLSEVVLPCGCAADFPVNDDGAIMGEAESVEHCSLHGTAPQMVEALLRIKRELAVTRGNVSGLWSYARSWDEAIDAALAAAGVKP